MTDLSAAIAAARAALQDADLPGDPVSVAICDLLAALDAQAPPAAPELLEALRVFVGCAYQVSTELEPRGHNWCEAWLDQALPIARAAIAKAAQAPPAAVPLPDAIPPLSDVEERALNAQQRDWEWGYRAGWNACRAAMLAAARKGE